MIAMIEWAFPFAKLQKGAFATGVDGENVTDIEKGSRFDGDGLWGWPGERDPTIPPGGV